MSAFLPHPPPLLSSRAKRSEAKDLGNIKMDEHVDALEILQIAITVLTAIATALGLQACGIL